MVDETARLRQPCCGWSLELELVESNGLLSEERSRRIEPGQGHPLAPDTSARIAVFLTLRERLKSNGLSEAARSARQQAARLLALAIEARDKGNLQSMSAFGCRLNRSTQHRR